MLDIKQGHNLSDTGDTLPGHRTKMQHFFQGKLQKAPECGKYETRREAMPKK
jgi:hypothetical protein